MNHLPAPFLSIIVPTIGRPQFLPLTLKCLAEQKFTDFEVIISDNAAQPPVNKESVVKQLAGRSHTFVRRHERLAFSDHFNQCLSLATGQWVMFLSDDDLIADDFFFNVWTAVKDNTMLSLILSRQRVIDESITTPNYNFSSQRTEVFEGFCFLKQCLEGRAPDFRTAVSMVAKTSSLKEMGGFPSYPFGAHADNMLWIRLSLKGFTAYLPGGFSYRVYSTSVGLSMPVGSLILATKLFERDLLKYIPVTVSNNEIIRAWRKSNAATIIARWRRSFLVWHPSTWLVFQLFSFFIIHFNVITIKLLVKLTK